MSPFLEVPCSQDTPKQLCLQLKCPGCDSSYVGQTVRHMQRRFREHVGSGGTMRSHFDECNTILNSTPDSDIVEILHKSKSL